MQPDRKRSAAARPPVSNTKDDVQMLLLIGKRSHAGAVGVMQVLPSTAADVGIADIHLVENNVHSVFR